MLLPLRQGIIRPKYLKFDTDSPNIPSYLGYEGSAVTILASKKDSLILNFANLDQNIVYQELASGGKWENLPANIPVWLYWDLSFNTGKISYGYTYHKPVYGETPPTTPAADQHFFNLKTDTMQVWDGSMWNKKLRVFSCQYRDGSVDNRGFEPNISQVGLGEECIGGTLLLNNDKVIKANKKPITDSTPLLAQDNYHNGIKNSSKKLDGVALTDIPAYSCITIRGEASKKRDNKIGITTSDDYYNPCIGILTHKAKQGQVKKYVLSGYIHDPARFSWSEPPNTLLFVGKDGSISTTIPNRTSIQRVGYIVDEHTIFVDIKEKILIDPYIRMESEEQEEVVIPDTAINCSENFMFTGSRAYPTEQYYTLGSLQGYVPIEYQVIDKPTRFMVYVDSVLTFDSGFIGNTDYNLGNSKRGEFKISLGGLNDPITGNVYPFDHPENDVDGYPKIFNKLIDTAEVFKRTKSLHALVKVYSPLRDSGWSVIIRCVPGEVTMPSPTPTMPSPTPTMPSPTPTMPSPTPTMPFPTITWDTPPS